MKQPYASIKGKKKKSYPILNEETEIKNNEKEDMGQTV
jgi:hypothetical protein